jgi:pyruvate,water dikinase
MMMLFDKSSKGRKPKDDTALNAVKVKFGHFLSLLDQNNLILKTISELEEKSHGRRLFDIEYIRENLDTIRVGLQEIIERMISIGGDRYEILRDKFREIDDELQQALPGRHPVMRDDYTVVFDKLRRERAFSVGSKNAQLGEMKTRLDLPVPDGFAISAWAYKHFLDSNDLQKRISDLIDRLDIDSHDDLVRVSEQIRLMISTASVPRDLEVAIKKSRDDLKSRSAAERFSMRSSAIGEDSLFSFAGQYASFLNVRGRELVNRYKAVIAGKFTPKAIYYLVSHSLEETDLAMAVGCVAMIDAAAAGVAYTRNPIKPDEDNILVNSIYGLGRYLVDGSLTPDVFHISRETGKTLRKEIVRKQVRLVPREEGGTVDEPVPANEQELPSLDEDTLRRLAEIALKLEEHYRCPQDIEWAVDKSGKLFILQTRPLRVLKTRSLSSDLDPALSEAFLCRGTTVCPGAGAGKVFRVSSPRDLPNVPESAVLVGKNPFPGIVTVMEKISALVTEVGGVVSHMATLAREYRIPTIVGVSCDDELKTGVEVTVDATDGVIYRGIHTDVVESRSHEKDSYEDLGIFRLLQKVLARVSPLRLLNPAGEDFKAENCRSVHDFVRFAHQKAVEEMFHAAEGLKSTEQLGVRLKSDIPLDMKVIFIDESFEKINGKREIDDTSIPSEPMQSFWSGIIREGWPAPLPAGTVLATSTPTRRSSGSHKFSQSSFAILSGEYMIVGLHMGYHFTTVEAMCTDDVNRNFIKIQYKEGGAALDRRIRRVKLIGDVLSEVGFGSESKGDFLRATISCLSRDAVRQRLFIVGRLSLMTKQLDMALHNDEIAEWYAQDFKKRLGIISAD